MYKDVQLNLVWNDQQIPDEFYWFVQVLYDVNSYSKIGKGMTDSNTKIHIY